MPRMTRTQKYANLREQLANGKEENTTSSELSPFQNRLNNLQGVLNPSFNNSNNQNNTVQNEQFFEEVQIENTTPQNNNLNNQDSSSENAFELRNQDINNQITPAEDRHESQETVISNQEESSNNNHKSSYFDDFVSGEVETQSQTDDFNTYFNKDTSINEKNDEVFEDVKDNGSEIVNKERDTYLNKALNDAKNYNINNGLQTVEQLVENSIDEIRHPDNKENDESNEEIKNTDKETEDINNNQTDFNREDVPVDNKENVENEPADNTYAWTPFTDEEIDSISNDNNLEESKANDEEFSNTVSLEISKIMDEIPSVQEDDNNFKEDIVNENIEENIPDFDEVLNEPNVEDRVEDVVEIKNISEMEQEPIRDTFSSTIPFVVAENDEEIEDEIEEDKSNTVLNVILIILIVVLAAVLGLIIFYILKTKGIF